MADEELRAAMEGMNLRLADLASSAEERERENADLKRELEAVRAQTTAAAGAPAAQTPTSLIDTRMMSKPSTFTGAMDQWADWSFVFRAY